MKFNADGTFEGYLPGVYSDETKEDGKYTLEGNTLTITYGAKTEQLKFNEEEETIVRTYGNYQLTLTKKTKNDNEKNNQNEKIVGEWVYTSVKDGEKETSLRDIFGSGIENGSGNMKFNEDGSFVNNMPGITSSETETTGTYTLNGTTITLKYKDKTETLQYNEEQEKIEQKYGNYTLMLVRKGKENNLKSDNKDNSKEETPDKTKDLSDNTVKPSNLPKTGVTDAVLKILLISTCVIAVVCLVKKNKYNI